VHRENFDFFLHLKLKQRFENSFVAPQVNSGFDVGSTGNDVSCMYKTQLREEEVFYLTTFKWLNFYTVGDR
jgi:hypothetical protein